MSGIAEFLYSRLKTLTPNTWDRFLRYLDSRFGVLEEQLGIERRVTDQILQRSLQVIEDGIGPSIIAAEQAKNNVQAIADLGMLLSAPSVTSVTLGTGTKTFLIPANRRNQFAPAVYVMAYAGTTFANAMSGHVVSWNRSTGTLVLNVDQVIGAGTFDNWTIGPIATTSDLEALRDQVVADRAAVQTLRNAAVEAAGQANGSVTAANNAKDAAQGALASFNAVWYGPRDTEPFGAALGSQFLDTSQTPNVVKVLTEGGWAPTVTVSIGGSRQQAYTATEGQTGPFTVDGGFSIGSVNLNGVELFQGSGVTLDPVAGTFTFTDPLVAGDLVVFRGYLANDVTDIFTKAEADNRFARLASPATFTEVIYGTKRILARNVSGATSATLTEADRLESAAEFYGGLDGKPAFVAFHIPGVLAAKFGIDADGLLKFGSTTVYEIWHAGHQGPGTGMNADLLDGQHAAHFATASDLSGYIVAAAEAFGYRVRVDAAQSFNDEQRGQARANIGAGVMAGFRNKIINPRFEVRQRGDNFNSVTAPAYTVDRWRLRTWGSGAAGTVLRAFSNDNVAKTRGKQSLLAWERTAGTTASELEQRIESVTTLAGKKATLAVEGYAGSTGDNSVVVEVYQTFGTGGSAAVLVGTATLNFGIGASVERAVFDFPSIAGKTVGAGSSVQVVLKAGTSAASFAIRFLDIALVEGDATADPGPFADRGIMLETLLCKRYYQRITCYLQAQATAASEDFAHTVPLVPMRVAPSLAQAVAAAPADQIRIMLTAFGGATPESFFYLARASAGGAVSTRGEVIAADAEF